VVIKN